MSRVNKYVHFFQVPDELEGVTNGTLANIIRQLSSLSRHAEEIFGNLFCDAESIASRSSNLQAKIDRLAIRVTQLDSTVEEGRERINMHSNIPSKINYKLYFQQAQCTLKHVP